MKQNYRLTLLLLLREGLKNFFLYWLTFCLLDFVHRGHYSWSDNIIVAAVLSPVIPLIRRCCLERNGGTRKAKYSVCAV